VGYNGRNRGFRRISPIGRKGVAAGRTALSSPDGCKGGTARDWTEVVAGSFIRGSTLAHICYRARSATAKNSAMAIAAGLIWRAIFAFIGIRFTFSFGKFFPTLQNFRNQNFCRGLQGVTTRPKRKGNRRARPPLPRCSACYSALKMAIYGRRAAPKASPGTARMAVRCCLSKNHCAGLIQITADFGSPSAYPAPGSRVTTTLYA